MPPPPVPTRRWAAVGLAFLAAFALPSCSSTRSGGSGTPTTGATGTTLPADGLLAAACDHDLRVRSAGTVTAPEITEASGIAASRANPGRWWVHNDSGDSARFFLIGGTGALEATVVVDGATAHDWEDIAVGPPRHGSAATVYIGDIGDNGAMKPGGTTRPDLQVYRVAEPLIPSGQAATTVHVTAERLTLRYPDGAYDAETLIVDPRSGDLFVVTKDWRLRGRSRVFEAPGDLPAGSTTVLKQVAKLDLRLGTLVTGGDVSADGSVVALRSYGGVLLYPRPAGQPLAAAFSAKPCSGPLPIEKQGEAIGFAADGRSYATLSEGSRPTLHVTSRR